MNYNKLFSLLLLYIVSMAYANIICHPTRSFDGSVGKVCVSDNKHAFESMPTVMPITKKDVEENKSSSQLQK